MSNDWMEFFDHELRWTLVMLQLLAAARPLAMLRAGAVFEELSL